MPDIEKFTDDPMVMHPNHYKTENGLEAIDVIEAFTEDLCGAEATNTGNALKYLLRWKKKNGLQDLEKAEFYVKRLIEIVKAKQKEKVDNIINDDVCNKPEEHQSDRYIFKYADFRDGTIGVTISCDCWQTAIELCDRIKNLFEIYPSFTLEEIYEICHKASRPYWNWNLNIADEDKPTSVEMRSDFDPASNEDVYSVLIFNIKQKGD